MLCRSLRFGVFFCVSLFFFVGVVISVAEFGLSATLSESNDLRPETKQTISKSVGHFRRDLKAFVARTKNKEEPTQRFNAIVDLCYLHSQLVNDERFEDNQQLKGFRAIAASRLLKCKREIELEMKRHERRMKQLANQNSRSSKSSDIRRSPKSSYPDRDSENEVLEKALYQDLKVLTRLSGGPVNVWKYTGGNYGPNGICDFGPDLVELIETTIAPDSWRSNGGTGVIHYYRPLRILVISASSQIHNQVTDLLNQLD